jgi:hypothetical protein
VPRLATTNIAVLARVAGRMNRRYRPIRSRSNSDLSTVTTLWLGTWFEPIADPFGWPAASMMVFVITFFCHNISPYFESGHWPRVLAILGPPDATAPCWP